MSKPRETCITHDASPMSQSYWDASGPLTVCAPPTTHAALLMILQGLQFLSASARKVHSFPAGVGNLPRSFLLHSNAFGTCDSFPRSCLQWRRPIMRVNGPGIIVSFQVNRSLFRVVSWLSLMPMYACFKDRRTMMIATVLNAMDLLVDRQFDVRSTRRCVCLKASMLIVILHRLLAGPTI